MNAFQRLNEEGSKKGQANFCLSHEKQVESYLGFQRIFLFNKINKTILGKNDVTQNQSGVVSDIASQGGARSSLWFVR